VLDWTAERVGSVDQVQQQIPVLLSPRCARLSELVQFTVESRTAGLQPTFLQLFEQGAGPQLRVLCEALEAVVGQIVTFLVDCRALV
jgi:hypothetical protein